MTLPFLQRQFDPSHQELMDLAELHEGEPSAELKRDLANLRWLNQRFGARSLIRHFLNRWTADRPHDAARLRVLDLATGEADLPREITHWCRARNLAIEIDAVDLNTATLAVAKNRCVEFPEIRFHQGDIREWGDGSWDIVLCSLALHHFDDADAVRVLTNARRLALQHLLVADLERSLLGGAGIWLLTTFLLREPMTVHDARLSIRRAFSFHEFGKLARDAGWRHYQQAHFPITRQAVWIDDCTKV